VTNLTFETEITALVVIDPYNDFISEGGKVWDRVGTCRRLRTRLYSKEFLR